MARIYIARSTGIGSFERHVVLKLITPERANDIVAVQMFLDEARLAASLNHQNVAQVFEVGEDGGIHYLAMEYVHGQDLRALLAKAGGQGTRVPLELALTVVAGAAAGLHHAHERRGPDGVPLGIVHRDVSPSNIMIGYDGAVKLLDFGIAKAAARSVETQSGIIKGKFAYMAPEQCRGRDVDRRSDVFSLGIILYEITTQHRCFRADSDFDTMHRIVTGDVVRPSRLIQNYPQALEAIVMKALAVDANQRYQSAGLLLEALEAYAVAARMSLSTMALGRFMRDLFGEQPEPWLTNTGRIVSPVPQKESTISSTNDAGNRLSARRVAELPASDSGPAGLPASDSGPASLQGATVLDLPRSRDAEPAAEGEGEHEDPSASAWSSKQQPTTPLAYPISIPPGGEVRLSRPMMVPAVAPVEAPLRAPGGEVRLSRPMMVPAVAPVESPLGAPGGEVRLSRPMMVPAVAPVEALLGAPLAPAAPAVADPSRNDRSYPRYEPPAEVSEEVQLKPNRRPLVIGAGLILVAAAVMIAMTIGGSGGTVDRGGAAGPSVAPEPSLRPAPPAEASAAPSTVPAVAGTGSSGSSGSMPAGETVPAPAAPDAQPPLDEETIGIKVTSDPPGADVLLAGKPIGTTPLETRIKRGTGSAFLTVRRAKYHEITTRIDLARDFTKDVALRPIDDKDDDKKRAEEERRRQDKQLEAKRLEERRLADAKRQEELRKQQELRRQQELKRQEDLRRQQEAKKPKCQNPAQYNPFDTSCLGMPGASPTGACPACKDFK